MAKFMIKVSYLAEGSRGLLKDGGTARRAIVEKATQGLGGSVEMFYYALGEDDAYLVVNVPDMTSALALSLAVNATGAVRLQTIPLLSCEEMDEVCHKSVTYRAPGA
jgi:uncharacterized protein with GYD domain